MGMKQAVEKEQDDSRVADVIGTLVVLNRGNFVIECGREFQELTDAIIATNKLYIVTGATLYHFGLLASSMHNAWLRIVAGRLKSDYQYSSGIVYNNFPWPTAPGDKQTGEVEAAAQAVLDARDIEFKRDASTTLATLYDPDLMPPALAKAHQALDRAVDAAYAADGGKRKWNSDAERVAFLFELYLRLTNLQPG